MQCDLEEGLHRGAAQVHGSVGEGIIHLLQLGHHIEDHIGQAEGHMGDQQCPEGQTFPHTQHLAAHEDEQQRQADTGDDIGVGHGDVGQIHDHLAHLGLQTVDAHGGQGAQNRGNEAGQNGNQQRVTQQTQQMPVLEQAHILLQGEAFKFRDVLAGVEGCDDQHRHGHIQENEDQNGQYTVEFLHTMTPPSSLSPLKRFISPVHTNTSAISTRLSAAPRLGLLACLNRRSMTSPMRTVLVLPSFWEM